MSRHDFPSTPGDRFPTPPRTVEDQEGREISLRAVGGDGTTGESGASGADESGSDASVTPTAAEERDAAAAMYDAFDPADRAQGVPPAGADRVRTWLDDLLAEGLNVLAWHGDDVVGHAVLMPGGDVGWELAIFVHQPYQSAGIGTELLRTLLGLGCERGVECVWLTVERWNRPAIALYESVGFEPSDAERFEMGMSMRLAEGE